MSQGMDAGGNLELAAIQAGGAPRLALPVNINADALSDLVYLSDGSPAPQYVLTAAVHVFVVNSSWDLDDDTIGDGKCDISGPSLNWGLCSLRAAIQEANASPGLDEIQLSFRYSPSKPLPQITEALLIKGTDPGAEINGNNAGSNYGLHFNSSASTVQGIKIREFQWPAIYLMTGGNHIINGVQISDNLGRGITIGTSNNQLINSVIVNNVDDGVAVINASGNVLTQNKIGIKSDGNAGGNRDSGIYLSLAANTVIGGSAANRNVISANNNGGIHVGGSTAGTLIQSNYIGSGLDGIQFRGNTGRGGVHLDNASSITIGGTSSTYRNVIGANMTGITVQGNSASGNVVRNNYIGVNTDGTGRLDNFVHAVKLIPTGTSNSVQVKDNVIGGDAPSGHGVYIFGSASTPECIPHDISNNYIGTNTIQTASLGVGMDGIHIEGVKCSVINANVVKNNFDDGIDVSGLASVTATITNNIAVGNASDGIEINTDFNQLTDNITGSNLRNGVLVSGNSNTLLRTAAGSNTGAGIVLHGNDNLIQGPGNNSATISYNSFEGLVITGNYNDVLSTYIIGNTSVGVSLFGDNNVIGSAGSSNLINGNAYGVRVEKGATGNQIVANYIGVEANGTLGAGNALVNVLVEGDNTLIGGATAGAGNVIADSPRGILLQTAVSGTTIRYNKIGTNAAGTAGLTNSIGVKIEKGSNNTIADNQIAFNGDGIIVEQGTGNSILRNRIYNSTRLGIDLLPTGVTVNDDGDPDAGANTLQNFPVLTAAGTSGRIQGSLNSAPNTSYTLNFFSVPSCDASGYGEGEVYLGQLAGSTNASGVLTFDQSFSPLVLNQFVTATATDAGGNTSEYSRCVKVAVLGGAETFTVNLITDVVDALLTDGICDTNLGTAGDQCSLRAAIQQANANAGANTIVLPGGTYVLTRAGTSENAAVTGDLDITDALTINGAGAHATVLEAAGLDRGFEIRSPAAVTIKGLTIQGGNPGNSTGGGILVNSGASLDLDTVTLQNNQVGTSAGGGGITNLGGLSVSSSAIINNQAGMNGGGLYQSGGTSTWRNSTFSGNQSKGSGGGIAGENNAVIQLSNVTVAYNTADSDNNGGDGGGLYQSGSGLILQNSIVAHNLDLSFGIYKYGQADCAGAFASGGYNLIGDQSAPYGGGAAGCTLTGGTSDSLGGQWFMTNYLTFTAGLGALQLNGGTTPSHSPVASASGLTVDWGSPAIPGSGGSACEAVDQRGQARPIDGGTNGIADCDRGAVELIPVTVSVNDVAVTEGGTATFTVSTSSSAQIQFTVNYVVTGISATAGSDFTAASGQLTFPVGITTQTVPVSTLTDTLNEPDETFQIELTNATYVFIADGKGIGTIQDTSPLPALLINDVSMPEGDAGQKASAAFNVTLNSASGKQVSVGYTVNSGTATAGEDFIQHQGILTFPPGVSTQILKVSILGDDLKEGNETYTITLANPSNASLGDASGVGTIQDDDIPAITINDAIAVEGDSGTTTLFFTVLLSKPSIGQITVNFITSPGTALAGSDYSHTSGTLTFAAGETAKLVAVNILGDTSIESTETFTVSLNTPTGGAVLGDSSATGSIQDNDSPPLLRVFLPMIRR
jgi:CSLREA domain-containing protein